MLAVEGERGACRFRREEGVDDDDARVALNDGHHREIEPSHLVDARHHLEQALLDQEVGLAPQAGIHGQRGLGLEESVRIDVPHHAAVARTTPGFRAAMKPRWASSMS